MSLPFCARRACGPFPPSADGEIPSPATAYCFATRLHRRTAAGKWSLYRKGHRRGLLRCFFCAVAAALSSAAVLRCTRGAAAYSPQPGGSLFLGSRFPVQPSCVSNTLFPGGGFRRRCGGNGFQKDRHPLRWFLSSWDSIFRPFWETSERRNASVPT